MNMKKTLTLTVRLSADYKEKIEYLKLLPGGATAAVERMLDGVTVDRTLMNRLKSAAKR